VGLFKRESPEDRFWSWFVANSDRIHRFESDQNRVFADLAQAFERYSGKRDALVFAIGKEENGVRDFVVSADGISSRFSAVKRLVAAAPSMPAWTVTAFRQPEALGSVNFRGMTLSTDAIWYRVDGRGAKTDLTLFVPGLTAENKHEVMGAAFILLDALLGEYVTETRVGAIEAVPLPPDPQARGLAHLPTLAGLLGIDQDGYLGTSY
jgi:hypothetical protein